MEETENEEMIREKTDDELAFKQANDHSPSFYTLHYALATKVDALYDRIRELTAEVRQPKAIPWIPIISIVIGVFAVIATVGGLVEQNIAGRIISVEKNLEHVEQVTTSRITEIDTRLTHSDQSTDAKTVPRNEIEGNFKTFHETIKSLQENAKRVEEVNLATVKLQREIEVSQAEFKATIDAIHQRMLRNETYIEKNADKSQEAINLASENITKRLDSLYGLYRDLEQRLESLLLQEHQALPKSETKNGGK